MTQQLVLGRHVGAARFAYNQCLALVRQGLDARSVDASVRVPWTGFDLINTFNGWKRSSSAGQVMVVDPAGVTTVVPTGLVWRGEVHQQVFEEAAVDLGRALAAFNASRHGTRQGVRVGFPRFRRKTAAVGSFRIRNKTSRIGTTSIRVGGVTPRSVTLPKIGTVVVREDTRRLRRLLANQRATIMSATIRYRRVTSRWTVSLIVHAADLHPAAQHPLRPEGDSGGWVGVDRGLSAFVVAADTHGQPLLRVDDPPRPLRAGMAKLRHLSRDLSRKQKRSANRRKAIRQLARQHIRIRNIRHEFLHQVARRLVKTHDRLVMEDLNITGMTANHRLAAAINDAAWAQLARIIDYQQAWHGGQIIYADRWFPSTKTCSRCGALATAVPLSVRVFTCPACGLELDRDVNAAANLATWAEQHHARVRDPQAGGPVTNAYPEAGPPPTPGAQVTRPVPTT